MTGFILALAFFFLIHTLVSGTALRQVLIDKLGDGGYRAVFIIASIVGLVWIVVAYPAARAETEILWGAARGLIDSAVLIMPIVFVLVVAGMMTPNPTLVTREKLLEKEGVVRGLLRITRHPFLWGVTIWGLLHLAMTGHSAAVLLFGTFAAVAVLGTYSIDHKRAKAFGVQWQKFRDETSNLPFGAIVTKRNKLKLGEIGWFRFLASIIAFAIVLYGHQWLFGKSPLPGGMSFY